MKWVLIFVLNIYQKLFSFDHGIPHKLFPNYRVCLYYPSCSEYTKEAIKRYGTFQGGVLGIKRIVRCNPMAKGGQDPVPDLDKNKELSQFKKILRQI